MALHNLARVTSATTGTGTLTLGSAVSGFLTFADAGVTDGETVTYAIRDGAASEIGRGVYTASGTTLTRATILESTNGGAAINCSGAQEVFISAAAEDVMQVVRLSTETLGGDGSFANVAIPTGYDEIWIRCRVRTADAGATDRIGLRVGTGGSLDTSGNYAYTTQYQGSSAGGVNSATGTSFSSPIVPGNGGTASYFGIVEYRIYFPGDTSQWRNIDCTGGHSDTGHRVGHGVCSWKNAAGAIDIVNILGITTATFKAGSRMTVLGVRYANP